MSGTEVVQGLVVLALAGGAATLELAGRHPAHAGFVFRTKPGLRYVGVNVVAGGLAFAVVMILDVQFRDPNGLWLVLVCGVTGLAVLRSGVVTESGLAGPGKALLNMRTAFESQIQELVQVREARQADDAVIGLDWELDREGLGTACLIISKRGGVDEREAMAARIEEAGQAATDPGLRMSFLASALRDEFGLEVLRAAARRVRRSAP